MIRGFCASIFALALFTSLPVSASPPRSAARQLGEYVVHGDSYWAVYVVVGPVGSPELDEAARALRERRARLSTGGIYCDWRVDNAPPLPVPEDTHTVSVYFKRKRDAERFARTLPRPPAGIVNVVVGCAD